MYICEYCGASHDGSYGSGRFCSSKCARKYAHKFISEEGRKSQIEALNKFRYKSIRVKKLDHKSHSKAKSVLKQLNQYKSSLQVGKLGEIKAIKRLIQYGIPVYIPLIDSYGADLIADIGGRLLKIQVKSSSRQSPNGSVQFELRRTGTRYNAHGTLVMDKRTYEAEDIDYFILYNVPDDDLYMIKNTGIRSFTVRKSNGDNYKKHPQVNYSRNYEFDRILEILQSNLDPEDIIEVE